MESKVERLRGADSAQRGRNRSQMFSWTIVKDKSLIDRLEQKLLDSSVDLTKPELVQCRAGNEYNPLPGDATSVEYWEGPLVSLIGKKFFFRDKVLVNGSQRFKANRLWLEYESGK